MTHSVLPLIGTAGRPPAPSGHGEIRRRRRDTVAGIDDGDPRAPFQIADQRRTELRIVGQPCLVSRFAHQCHPTLTPNFSEMTSEMAGDHTGVGSALLAIALGTADHLPPEIRHGIPLLPTHAFYH